MGLVEAIIIILIVAIIWAALALPNWLLAVVVLLVALAVLGPRYSGRL